LVLRISCMGFRRTVGYLDAASDLLKPECLIGVEVWGWGWWREARRRGAG